MKRVVFCLSVLFFVLCGLSVSVKVGKAAEETCRIYVEGGYATLWDEETRVTEVSVGSRLGFYWEVSPGEWIKSYTITCNGEYVESSEYMFYAGLSDGGKIIYGCFYSPARTGDLVITPEIGKQTPVTIDFSNGIYSVSGMHEEYHYDAESFLRDLFCTVRMTEGGNESYWTADCDRDGAADYAFQALDPDTDYESVEGHFLYGPGFLVPLSSTNLSGTFIQREVFGSLGPVTFCFGNKELKAEYAIRVQNGHAVNTKGETVTSAVPGTQIYLVADTLDGKYVYAWEDATYGFLDRIAQGRCYQDRISFIMPRCDVSWQAVLKDQTPLRIDLTSGYWISPFGHEGYNPYNYRLFTKKEFSEADYELGRTDLDGDGTYDIAAGYRDDGLNWIFWKPDTFFVIPLSSSSVRGEYVWDRKNDGTYGPYTICFPTETKAKYAVTVIGGHAEDENHRVITEAAPGEVVRVIGDSGRKCYGATVSPEYYNLQTLSDSSMAIFVMPAHDITYTLAGSENGDDRTDEFTIEFFPNEDGTRWIYPVSAEERQAVQKEWNAITATYGKFGISMDDGYLCMDIVCLEETEESKKYVWPKKADIGTIHFTFRKDAVVAVGGVVSSDSSYPQGITSGNQGEWLMITKDDELYRRNDGFYFVEYVSDNDVWFECWGDKETSPYYHFKMPGHAVTVVPKLAKTTPVTIDLTEEDYMASADVRESFENEVIRGTNYKYVEGGIAVDIDGDFHYDVVIGNNNIIRPLPSYSCGEKIVLTRGNEGTYYPFTLVCDVEKMKARIGAEPEPDNKVSPPGSPKDPEDTREDNTTPAAEESGGKDGKKGVGPLWFILSGIAVLFAGGGTAWYVLQKKADQRAAERREAAKRLFEEAKAEDAFDEEETEE